MTILQQPDILSLSGNIKEFRIATTETIPFVLKQGNEEIVTQSYDPGKDGIVIINLRDIVHSRLSFTLQESALVYEQSSLAATFTAVISGTEITFRVIRSGVDRLADTATNFLTQNFLTWQPSVKGVTYYSPEFLTYYAVVACTAKLRAYFTDDSGVATTQQDITLANFDTGKAYTIPLQYASVAEKLGNKLPGYYDVWIESSTGNRLTYIQRYYASDMLSEQEQWILFENSLGGIDTFRAYGSTDFTGDHTHNIAEIDEVSTEYRVDTTRKFQKNTGHLKAKERQWLLDFFPSQAKYIYTGTYLRSIVVTESNVTYTDRELPSNYTFTYQYADARPLLNLPRTDIPSEALNITVPSVGSFTVPPRLVEFPRLPLTEGALFPVQNPYSEEWNTTTAGSLGDFIAERLSQNYGGGGGVGHQHNNIDLLQLLTYAAEYLLVAGKKIKAGYADKAGSIDGMDEMFLRKDKVDIAKEIITFLKGLLIGNNGSGITVLENGMSQAVVDYLYVKVKAIFDELEVKKKTYVGGEQILSPAGMKCIKVEELTDVYRCFFKAEEDGIEIENQFTPGTLAISQECNIKVGVSHNVGNRYYWRAVTAVGVDYIDLSKTKCDPNIENDIPAAGDDIVALGHDTDITRQGAIVLSSVNEVAPSIVMYQGIDSFSLDGEEAIGFDYDKSTGRARMRVYGDAYIGSKDRSSYIEYTNTDGVDIKGILHIENGSTGAGNLTDFPDEVQKAVDLGSVNLLRNSGFTGQYENEELSPDTVLSPDSELYNSKLSKWTGIATVSEDTEAVSGYSVILGSLSQNLKPIIGENYVVSYKAMGTSVSVSCGNYSVVQPLTAERTKYVHKFKFAGNPLFLISGTAVLCDLKLERGSIATDWMPSPLDNDKAMAEMQALSYIQDAIRDGSVDMIGGLMLANMIMTGSYKDGKMQKVTAGMSGIYNDDDDVAFWAGGTLEQAINAVMKYKDNPNYVPTEEELKGMANFVATHGGRAILNDVVVMGYIYALGGRFRGRVEADEGYVGGMEIIGNSMRGVQAVMGVYMHQISGDSIGSDRKIIVNNIDRQQIYIFSITAAAQDIIIDIPSSLDLKTKGIENYQFELTIVLDGESKGSSVQLALRDDAKIIHVLEEYDRYGIAVGSVLKLFYFKNKYYLISNTSPSASPINQ